jgi:hypothetical protein
MPIPAEKLAMVGSDWPGADLNREKSTRLVGPRRGEETHAHTSGRLAKFHAPELVLGPEGGPARLATNPRASDARNTEALFRAAW